MKSELDFAGLKDAANKLNQPERNSANRRRYSDEDIAGTSCTAR